MGLSSRERKRRVLLVLVAARLCRLGGGESNAHSGVVGVEGEMRISDVLQERDPDCSSSVISGRRGEGRRRRASPRCLLSRLLPRKHFFLSCRSCEGCTQEEVGEEGAEVSGATSLGSTASHGKSVSGDGEGELVSAPEATASGGEGVEDPVGLEERGIQSSDCSEHKPEQAYLNIGMGAGLMFLLTRSVTEFNKMIELRSEMEKLLKEIKGSLQRKDVSPHSGDSKNNLACCSSDSCRNMEWSNLSVQDCNPCLELVEISCSEELDGYSTSNKGFEEGTKSLGIVQMEAELKSELQLLQLNVKKQESSESLTEEMPGEVYDLSDSFSLSLGEHPEGKEQADEGEEDTGAPYGVCPHELTRRLRELLETQQQERIAELETALELAHIKLREKEMEACWWRDTARLVSQRKQETLQR